MTAEYTKLLAEHKMENIITTCCPSANDLVKSTIHSWYTLPGTGYVSHDCPRKASERKNLGRDVKVVFLGPCIAKKKEAMDPRHEGLY